MPDFWNQLACARTDAAAFDRFCREGRQREEAREALLREVSLVLACTRARRVLDLTMDALVRLSRAQSGFILLARPDGSHEVAAARQQDLAACPKAVEAISRRIVGDVLASGKPLRIEDALHTPPYALAESITRLRLLSVLCVPVRMDGRVGGAIYLENRKLSGVFTEATERLIVEFAERIGLALQNARAFEEMERARDDLRAALAGGCEFEGMVGSNALFRAAQDLAVRAAGADIPVLIEGESGTGKELFARAVHLRSPRRAHAFVSVNCAALPSALLESELFGHTAGAFTGAVRGRAGLFASAHRGTLFLDEVGETAPEMQAKLLRVLQSGEFRPVGSDTTACADVRIVAATRRDLAGEVRAGRFREDLFFRLNGIAIRLPPLRDRKEDIPLLIARFLEKHAPATPLRLADETRACLMAYRYPGNVRELETLVRRAVLFARDGVIGLDALPPEVASPEGETLQLPMIVPTTAAELRERRQEASRRAAHEVERAFLLHALEAAGGRPGNAARRAAMNRSQFERMLSRHGLAKRRK